MRPLGEQYLFAGAVLDSGSVEGTWEGLGFRVRGLGFRGFGLRSRTF